MKNEISNRIISILKLKYLNQKEGVNQTTRLRSLPGFDSLKYLTFLLDIEKMFGIDISANDMSSMKTIKEIVNYIKKVR